MNRNLILFQFHIDRWIGASPFFLISNLGTLLCLLGSLLLGLATATSAPVAIGNETLTIAKRPVVIRVPACAQRTTHATTATASRPLTLVISFHAWGTTAKEQEQSVDQFVSHAGSGGHCDFLFVYPQGVKRAWGPMGMSGYSWNAGGCCPNAAAAGGGAVDDVGFVRTVTAAVRERYGPDQVDAARLFLSGVSNGGMMVNRLACELEENVTAVATVSGPLVNGTATAGTPFSCRSGRRVPILHIHGLKDPVVPFHGCNETWSGFGKMCTDMRILVKDMAPFPDVPTFVAGWRARNGIAASAAPVAGFRNNTVSCQSWSSAGSDHRNDVHDNANGDDDASPALPSTLSLRTNVTLCVATEEGHAWPGSTAFCKIPQFRCTQDMSASAHILSFFQARLRL